MAMPAVRWKAKAMDKKEHREYIDSVKEAIADLDHALRCYYISLGDDYSMTDEDKVAFLKHAFEEGLKEVGVTYKTVVRFND
ncbi:hypothetical protein V7112_08660 [Bacillus sp. JJ1566]|uniref:hypothetical protein n=1 Tax=Bacillus sp. JJ1566 TaxID=3122961 RepID=UPI002FFE7EDD